jgi:hypothetical protein
MFSQASDGFIVKQVNYNMITYKRRKVNSCKNISCCYLVIEELYFEEFGWNVFHECQNCWYD